MADREDVLAWLRSKRYRIVRDGHPWRRIVDRLIDEGYAEWLCCDYRVRIRQRTATTEKEPGT